MTHSMFNITCKFSFLALFIVLFSSDVMAQGKYFSGSGCGYATTQVTANLSTLSINSASETRPQNPDPNPSEAVVWFPQPSRESINFNNESGEAFSAKLVNLQGANIKIWSELGGIEGKLNLEGIAAGIYMMKVLQNGKQSIRKIIIR